MKVAVAGKGGVGKSTLAAGISLLLARSGRRVLAVDADPAASLAALLGVPEPARAAIVPIARHADLVEERTGAKAGTWGQAFRLNPEVADIAERFGLRHAGVDLLVLGAVERAGAGCACPESVLLKTLLRHLVLRHGDFVILDMEAGVEHLGRGTLAGVDLLLVVVNPGMRSIETGLRIRRMAREIGLERAAFVANRVDGPGEEAALRRDLAGERVLAVLGTEPSLAAADREGRGVLAGAGDPAAAPLGRLLDAVLALKEAA